MVMWVLRILTNVEFAMGQAVKSMNPILVVDVVSIAISVRRTLVMHMPIDNAKHVMELAVFPTKS